jgi:protein SCO1/2
MYRIVFLLLSSLLLVCCKSNQQKNIELPYYNTPDFTPLFIADNLKVKTEVNHTIGDFSLLNQDSILIDQNDIEGKIHVANFIFSSCGSICPTMTFNMKTVNNQLKNDTNIVFLSYSVTPWIDKPFVLKKYKTKNDIDNENWHFLTGTKGVIYTLARTSYFAEEDIGYSKDSSEFLHTEHFILVDKTKRIRGIYNGTLALEMQALIDDIKTLKREMH